jgi:hypothetical protein
VLFFGCKIREDDLIVAQASLPRLFEDVLLTSPWEAEQPEHRVWDSFENVNPNIEHGGVDLVELIEATEDELILTESESESESERERERERVRGRERDCEKGEEQEGDQNLFDAILCSAKCFLIAEKEPRGLLVIVDEAGVRHHDQLLVIV